MVNRIRTCTVKHICVSMVISLCMDAYECINRCMLVHMVICVHRLVSMCAHMYACMCSYVSMSRHCEMSL